MGNSDKTKKVHHGHNVRRVREILGVKQGALAIMLDMSQQTLSYKEAKEIIEDETLEKISQALKVPIDLLKNFDEDVTTIIIENNKIETNNGTGFVGQDYSTQTHNPIDKIIELANEKTILYERMLELEKEKIAWLEKLLNNK